MESTSFDPSLPGVRLLQDWLRQGRVLRVELNDGQCLEGSLRWQDPEFLALNRADSDQPVLLSRRAIALFRTLG